VKEWLKSVLNYGSYPKNKTGDWVSGFWTTLYKAYAAAKLQITIPHAAAKLQITIHHVMNCESGCGSC